MKIPFYYWLVVCGNNWLIFFWNSWYAWYRVGPVDISQGAPIFLVDDSERNTSCVVQVKSGKIQSKSILRAPAKAKVAIMGPVKGTAAMFIDTINIWLLRQSNEPQIQLVQKTCSFSKLQILWDHHSIRNSSSVKQPTKQAAARNLRGVLWCYIIM